MQSMDWNSREVAWNYTELIWIDQTDYDWPTNFAFEYFREI